MSRAIENILYVGHNIQLVNTILNLFDSVSTPENYCIEHLSCVDDIQAALADRKYSHCICELPVSESLAEQIAIDFPLLKTTYLSHPEASTATELSAVMEGLVSDEVKATLDYLSIPIFFKNKKGQYLACNSYFSRLFGLTPAQVIKKTAAEVLHSHLVDEIEKVDQKVFTDHIREFCSNW